MAIANFSRPRAGAMDFRAYWARYDPPSPGRRRSLFEQPQDWGFHIYAIGVYLLDLGVAERVEFWSYSADRGAGFHSNGILRIQFLNEADVRAYLEEYGAPDLFVNYGRQGLSVLRLLEGQCFRVHVPCLRSGPAEATNRGAECYLVDAEEFLDDRSMMYIPVVNTRQISPSDAEKERDFIYLASLYEGKRHDILVDAVRGSPLSGHLHPVDGARLDLTGTHITTSQWNERDVVTLLRTSRIAVYPGDHTSNPAAMWECVAAGLPIVVNRAISGGKHLVVPGVTGELASARDFGATMQHVLRHRGEYRPRAYFEERWGTVSMIERYLAFFGRMGWSYRLPSRA